jgi:hypothetical protein
MNSALNFRVSSDYGDKRGIFSLNSYLILIISEQILMNSELQLYPAFPLVNFIKSGNQCDINNVAEYYIITTIEIISAFY